ncbi:MAG: 50S ribosomal protein L15 [Patescibacteria group bacterium]
MTFALHNLKPAKGAVRRRRRVGRGHGSGRGTYSGRGMKGQRARTGGRNRLRQKGIRQMLLAQPKLGGFRSLRPKAAVVNLETLERVFPARATVNPKALLERGLVSRGVPIKILSVGELTKALTVAGCSVSKAAKAKIVAAGGTVNENVERRR